MEFLSRVAVLVLYSLLISFVSWSVARCVKPGLTRLLLLLPLFAVSYVPSTLFDRSRSSEAVLYYYCVSNYLWLVNCKLTALAVNRGPLPSYCHRPVLFTWLLVFPINVKAPGKSSTGGMDTFPDGMVLRLLSKVLGCAFFARMAVGFWDYGIVRDFSLSWLMYCLLTAVMELAAGVSWVVLGVQLMPHFDRPWLTTSISEFWSLRWNLVVGALLRDLVYAPILEGRLVRTGEERKHRSHLRQMIAVLCTFVASGWMHWAVIYYIVKVRAWFNLASFCVHGCVVVLERGALFYAQKHPTVEEHWNAVPWFAKACFAQFSLHLIAHAFFWRELVRCKEAWDLANALDIFHGNHPL